MNKLNVANVLAYVVNTFVTFISMTGIFGLTNGEVSAKYQTIITPAGWAFSIWGIIFTGELAFVVAQCFSSVACRSRGCSVSFSTPFASRMKYDGTSCPCVVTTSTVQATQHSSFDLYSTSSPLEKAPATPPTTAAMVRRKIYK